MRCLKCGSVITNGYKCKCGFDFENAGTVMTLFPVNVAELNVVLKNERERQQEKIENKKIAEHLAQTEAQCDGYAKRIDQEESERKKLAERLQQGEKERKSLTERLSKKEEELNETCCSIVVDIGGTGVRIGIISESGGASVQCVIINSIEDLSNEIKKRAPYPSNIAVSAHGFIDYKSGSVLRAPSAPYTEGNMKEKLEADFPNANVFVINDGEAHALALLKHSDIELGAINIAVGTAVGFGVIGENGQLLRSLSGDNFDVSHMFIRIEDRDSDVWWACGSHGYTDLVQKLGEEEGTKQFGCRLGVLASQLATIFRPRTVGFSGGFIAHNWKKVEPMIRNEFKVPILTSTSLIAQIDTAAALIGLATFLQLRMNNI